MLINLTEVFVGDTDHVTYELHVDMPFIHFNQEKVTIRNGVDVTLALKQSDQRDVYLNGTLKAQLDMFCGRCYESVDHVLTVAFSKIISDNTEETSEDVLEGILKGKHLDVEVLALNEMLLNLPMKVLCKPSCKGICMACGKDLNHNACTCDTTNVDVRWAGLKDLFDEKFKEV